MSKHSWTTYAHRSMKGEKLKIDGEPTEGYWLVKPQPSYSNDEPARFNFVAAPPAGCDDIVFLETLRTTEKFSDAYWRLQNWTLPSATDGSGYAATQEDAAALIDHIDEAPNRGYTHEMVLAAGFKLRQIIDNDSQALGSVRIYETETIDNRFFELMIKDHEVHLTFERNGNGYWKNLFRLESNPINRKPHEAPHFFPQSMQENFLRTAVFLALKMRERYIESGRAAPSKRTSRRNRNSAS